MTDIATLAGPSPIALAVPGAPPTATPASGGEASADPFAMLLASLAPAPGADAAPAPTVTTPITPITVALPTLPAAKTPAVPVFLEEPLVAGQDGDGTQDTTGDEGSSAPDQAEDPQLAMMLALANPPAQTIPGASAALAPAIPTLATTSGPERGVPGAPPAAPTAVSEGSSASPGISPAVAEPKPDAQARARFAAIAARLFGSTAAAPATRTEPSPAGLADAANLAKPTIDGAQSAPAMAASLPHGAAAPRIAAAAPSPMREAPEISGLSKDRVDLADVGQALFATPIAHPAQTTQAAGSTSLTMPTTDASVSRELSVARDGQWLDTLARDIAATAGKDGSLSFRLDPQHLGSLTVHINHSAEGASIRMTADTESGRAMLSDAQPRLIAEARAQGLTLRETSVDMGGTGAGSSGQQAQTAANLAQDQSQQRNPAPDQTFINLDAREGDEGERGREADTRSDLYA